MKMDKAVGTGYLICVEGHLADGWVDWPCEVEIHQDFDPQSQRAITLLAVMLPDPPALHGVLQTIRDLNLKLISVQLLDKS